MTWRSRSFHCWESWPRGVKVKGTMDPCDTLFAVLHRPLLVKEKLLVRASQAGYNQH